MGVQFVVSLGYSFLIFDSLRGELFSRVLAENANVFSFFFLCFLGQLSGKVLACSWAHAFASRVTHRGVCAFASAPPLRLLNRRLWKHDVLSYSGESVFPADSKRTRHIPGKVSFAGTLYLAREVPTFTRATGRMSCTRNN